MDNDSGFYFNATSNDDNSFMNNNNYTSIGYHDNELLLDHVYSNGFGYPFPPLSPIHLFQTPPPIAPPIPRTTTLTGELDDDGDNSFRPSLFSANCFQPMFTANDEFTSSSSVSQLLQFGESSSLPSQVQLQQPQQKVPNQHRHTTATTTTKCQRLKRRKIQQKKVVCRVPVDGITSDKWAWRKYGQKPIKGSPYPRGYYRCSSSKGCMAKKLVEKSYSDPAMLIITYKAEHNHPIPTQRSSLGGNSRQNNKLDCMSANFAPPTSSSLCMVESSIEDNNNKLLLQQTNVNVKKESWREEDNTNLMMRNNNELFMGLEVFTSGLSDTSPSHHIMY